MIEAVIGACYLAYGFEPTATAVREAFAPEIEQALERPADFKSALQERLARRGAIVELRGDGARRGRRTSGSSRSRRWSAATSVARGSGRSKKEAEQAAAAAALEARGRGTDVHLRSISLKGFKSFPDRTRLDFAPGVSVIVGPNGSGKSNVTDAVLWALGEQSPVAVRGAVDAGRDLRRRARRAGARRGRGRGRARQRRRRGRPAAVGARRSSAGSTARARASTAINGARCRLTDVIELLSDTGLGKEMHSIVSQGRVAEIVTSKPRDRRLLIEEAAGLGKHRKRRRRAQLKLERTQDNLDRALDVEREARTRLRPLKRQAEAAELHERLARQSDEARWTLARDAARVDRGGAGRRRGARRRGARRGRARPRPSCARSPSGARRPSARSRRAATSARRSATASTRRAPRSERITMRLEAARQAVATLAERAARRRALLAALTAEAEDDTGDDGGEERVAGLEAELEQLAQDRAERLARGDRRAGGAPRSRGRRGRRPGRGRRAHRGRPSRRRRRGRGRPRRAA